MATNIVGTFPILSRQKSQTDEYGFDYLTYQYVVKTSTIDSYIPKKDDIFIGLTRGAYSRIPVGGTSQYVVTDVESTPLQGDLTELTIQTVGTKNTIADNLPKTTIRQGGPLIFGIGSDIQATNPEGIGIASIGLQIEIKFLDIGGAERELEIYNTYISKVMPTSFRGVLLPKALAPFSFDYRVSSPGTAPASPPILVGVYGNYYGYCGKTMTTEMRGGLSLYTIVFLECGDKFSTVPTTTGSSTSTVYNFPKVG